LKKKSIGICFGIWQCPHERFALIPERHVKLFKNGRNQAVRIPREFELPGYDAIMRKDGNKLIIEAVPPKSLLALLATLTTLDEDFPPIADAVPDKVEI
jgi:antitoxin VapB